MFFALNESGIIKISKITFLYEKIQEERTNYFLTNFRILILKYPKSTVTIGLIQLKKQ